MIEVEVEFAAPLAKLCGKNKPTMHVVLDEGATLQDLFKILSRFKPIKRILDTKDKRTGYEIVVLIDGGYPLDGLLTKLNKSVKVTFLPIISGG